jgi:hypothetical protein
MEKGCQRVPYQCTKYLKENAQGKFVNRNVPEQIRSRIISSIFDKTGLVYSDSPISYFERESEVLEIFGHVGVKYLQDKLLPTLKEKNCSPESVKSHNSA